MFAFCFLTVFSFAQSDTENSSLLKNSPVDFSFDIKTNHLWRGLIVTDKPMLSSLISFKMDKQGLFTAGVWGGASVSNESDNTHYKEINYYLQYDDKRFSIGIWDLFNTRGVTKPDIWNYKKKETTHILDLRSSAVVSNKFPLKVELGVLLYGTADQELKDNSTDVKQRYSTYVQLGYPVLKDAKVNLDVFTGMGFALDGKTHLYGNGENGFDVVNVGFTASKVVNIGNFKIPFSATTYWNPSVKFARLQLSCSLF